MTHAVSASPDTKPVGKIPLAFIALLGALLPIQWFIMIAGTKVNFCAADFVILPVVLLLWRRWIHSAGLGRWVFALWVVNLISWACSLDLLTPDALLRESLKIGGCFLFALTGYAIGSHSRSERTLVYGAIVSALPISVIAIQSFFTMIPKSFIPDGRVSGPFTDPNAFACYLAMMIALVMSLRVDLLAIPLFIGAGLVTFSRTGFAGIAASLFLGLSHARLQRYLPIMALAALAVVVIWSNLWGFTVGYRVLQYQVSFDERRELWNRGLEVASAHPIIGIGRGNWEIVSGQTTLPHNTLLSVASDNGLVGVIVFFLPLMIWLAQGPAAPETRAWAITLLISLLGGIAVSLDNFRPFWLFTGVLVAQINLWEARHRAHVRAFRSRFRPAFVSCRSGVVASLSHFSRTVPCRSNSSE